LKRLHRKEVRGSREHEATEPLEARQCTMTMKHHEVSCAVPQASVVLSTAAKYTLSVIDATLEGRWAGKVTDMLHLFVYLIFFIIVFANYGLPLHLVRCCMLFHYLVLDRLY